jgi:RHS repeat-associated protein
VYKVPATGLLTERNKLTLGRREYEVSNHLGNVLATVSDLKLPAARVLSHTDYYAFGSAMPGRSGGGAYRYGFNGKEKAGEVQAETVDFGERMYGAPIGRFFSVDRFAGKFAHQSPYGYADNSPLVKVDHAGDSTVYYTRSGARIFASHDGLPSAIVIVPNSKLIALLDERKRAASKGEEDSNQSNMTLRSLGNVYLLEPLREVEAAGRKAPLSGWTALGPNGTDSRQVIDARREVAALLKPDSRGWIASIDRDVTGADGPNGISIGGSSYVIFPEDKLPGQEPVKVHTHLYDYRTAGRWVRNSLNSGSYYEKMKLDPYRPSDGGGGDENHWTYKDYHNVIITKISYIFYYQKPSAQAYAEHERMDDKLKAVVPTTFFNVGKHSLFKK